jgi:hypothetical protein
MDSTSILSVDLRNRVAAVSACGLSRRQAAFAVRCQRRERRPVAVARKPARDASVAAAGRRSTFDEIEAHVGLLLDAYKAPPAITLAELQALPAYYGTEVAFGTI